MKRRFDMQLPRCTRSTWRIVLLGLCGLLCAVLRASVTEELDSQHIRVRAATEADAKAWARFVALCSQEVQDAMGGVLRSDAPISVRIGEHPPPGPSDPLRIYVPDRTDLLGVTHRLAKSLLARHALGAPDRTVPVTPSVEWLGAAIVHRVLFGNRESRGFFEPDYQPARHAFAMDQFPNVLRLVTVPVSASEPRLFRLYALHCDVLLLALQTVPSGGESFPRRLIELEAYGRDTAAALTFLLAPSFSGDENLQAWYERAAVDVSRRGRRQSRVSLVEKRLQELITVPMVAPGQSTFTVTRIPIEDVPEKLDAYRLDKDALRNLQADIFELLKDAPALMQEPLSEYMKAFETLAQGKTWRFRREVRKAHEHMKESARRERQLEQYLDTVEQEVVPPDTRFAEYLDVIETYDERRRGLAPELHRYLDSFGR